MRVSEDEPINLVPVPVQTNHDPKNPDHAAFARGVWSVLNKQMTNRMVVYDQDSFERIGPVAIGSMLWAGAHACAWTESHPRNFIRWGRTLYRAS